MSAVATRPAASRLPAAASVPAPAQRPPALDGLDPAWSRLVTAPDAHGTPRTWHLLDNADLLAARDGNGGAARGTILAVHGNPTWSYLWRRLLAPAAEAGWRVVAVDQLDMGFSERTGTLRTLPERVRDLGLLTDALSAEHAPHRLTGPVVTLGHDWGGVVSLGWAVDHPDLLAGVLLLNTAVHQPEDAAVPAPLRLALASGVLGRATVTTPGFLETTLALGHPSLPRAVKDAYRAPYRTAERRGGVGAFVADIPLAPDHPSAAELDRVAEGVRALTVPSLVQWGPLDPVFRDRYLADLVDRLPGAQVHRHEGAGHLLAEDVDYVAPILAWLDAFGLGDAEGAASPTATATAASARPAGEQPVRPPLWHHLDERVDDPTPALVEMAPRGSTHAAGGPRIVSWRLLSRRVRELAAGLVAFGVRPGDRVSLLVPPGADLTAVLYACLRVGAVVVVADAGLGVRGLTRAVRGTQPRFVVGEVPGLTAARALGWPGRRISTHQLAPAAARALGVDACLADLVELGAAVDLTDTFDGTSAPGSGVIPSPAPDDVAAILFTSGSTGPAKGVVYTHDALAAVRDALAQQYDVGPDTGLVAGFAPFALLGPALGARSVTPDMDVTAPRTLTARAVAAAAARVDATVVFLSPAALANAVATADDLTGSELAVLARVRTFLSAGAPVAPALLAAAQDLMPNASAHTPYGMTEGLLMTDASLGEIATAQPDGPGGVLVGAPVADVAVRISALDGTGAATGAPADERGVTGEVVVSAPHLKTHYDRLWLTDRAAVRETPSDSATAGGRAPGGAGRWHRTGDVGHLDADGRLWIEGRLAHVLTTAAGPVTPVGPEQRVEALDTVARAAAVGVGPRGTQQLVLVVEPAVRTRRVRLAEPVLARTVRAAVGLPVAAVLVVPRLPTDIRHNSKVDRSALAAWAEGILAGGRMTRP
ncbi:alpha/beta fold hydrolase [Luteimicrobium subarcticum]|uniref:Acyl-CoA synthetase (AMP-forming)/AMP-acid ligase II n=1 Tax=Luteimicrobium subarcticum TaxID=620910 RepID=A0A2M8WQT5_9MICO|nr:alpha/beta fold hydrolase [Luteimicrobium subarcticum]PJI93302.1 acyl-CoA synthetase (AMP-forming)/AMP-acid ligase II [Luteimicrobium subarcticum]